MSDYIALYRKWRPVNFDDVCGQDAVTDVLKYEVKNGKISHAYLFCGSRGTGKTSCARILAKAVNCLHPVNGNPCNECEACRSIDAGTALDVIEMDAASNNGVDNVRDMKDEIAFTPAILRYRVYIIDEVHMMSGAAFNALLKTLEEPPAYVVFILATTEFNKLPTTIVSRCQRFDFRRMTSDVIIARLMKIASAEGIELTEDGARVIARAAQGGMRDAVSLLELCAGKHTLIDEKFVSENLGIGSRDSVYSLISAVLAADYSGIYDTIRSISMSSGDIAVFWQEFLEAYRDMLVVKNTAEAKSYLDLTDTEYEKLRGLAGNFTSRVLDYHISVIRNAMADMLRAPAAKRGIAEIALTEMANPKLEKTPQALSVRIEDLERTVAMMKMGVLAIKPTDAEQPNLTEREQPTSAECTAPAVTTGGDGTKYLGWGDVVTRIGELKKSLAVQFDGSAAYRTDNRFTVYMNRFFAPRLAANDENIALLRGSIAEREGLTIQDVSVEVRSSDEKKEETATTDLDSIF